MNLPKEVNILGTTYKIIYQTRKENESLISARGYCEFYTKEIFVDKQLFMDNKKGEYSEGFKDLYKMGYEVLRHEIIHAFVFESGLWNNCSWATNEEMTDWLALQFPKLNECLGKFI
jgi:hypothetical protein